MSYIVILMSFQTISSIDYEFIYMSKFKPGTVETNIINSTSFGRNQTYTFAMPVQFSDHEATEVADKSRRNFMCIEGANACE